MTNMRLRPGTAGNASMHGARVGLALLMACSSSNSVRAPAFDATIVAEIDATARATALVALADDRVGVAQATTSGDAYCPDCVGLDPAECPATCKRTRISFGALDVATGRSDAEIEIAHVFPRSLDHDVDQVAVTRIDADRVGLAWLECDNARCGLSAKGSCTARYVTLDVAAGTVSSTATLYTDRYGELQIVGRPTTGEVLVVTGKGNGLYGAGVRAAVYRSSGELLGEWLALGGRDAHVPAATATDSGFAILLEDPRPGDSPPELPCASSCDCSGSLDIDPDRGGVYGYELEPAGHLTRTDLIARGLVDDGHLPGGHYHDRQALAVAHVGGELVLAASQRLRMDAELFVGRGDAWSLRGIFDSPLPTWIGVIGSAEVPALLGLRPEADETNMRIIAGVATPDGSSYGAITDPLDSYIFAAAPYVTEAGIATTFLLRGVFDRSAMPLAWARVEIVRVTAR